MTRANVTFEYTLTVKTCIEDIAFHLGQRGIDPLPVIRRVIDQFEARVASFPLSVQVCPELLQLGCARYREYNLEEGYRVLYSVDNACITVHAILAQRQDIKQLLFNRLIHL